MKNWILLLILSNSLVLFSQRYETIHYGSWSNESTWKDNLVPPYQFSDSVIVKHPIIFDSIIESNAYFRIDSTGAICGHHKLIIHQNFHIYGYFQCDSLEVNGGLVKIFGPGDCVSTFQTHVFNGGSLSLTGGSLAVGPWFECRTSEYFFLEKEELRVEKLSFYPNPVSDFITIEGDFQNSTFQLLDAFGRIILNEKASSKLDLSAFENGIYFLKLIKDGETIQVQKIIKE